MPEISVCGTPQVFHKTVMLCEPAWTVTAVSPVDRFLLSLQHRHSCFLTSTYFFQLQVLSRSYDPSTLKFQPWGRKRRRVERLLAVAGQQLWWLQRLQYPHRWRQIGAAEGLQKEEERASSPALTKTKTNQTWTQGRRWPTGPRPRPRPRTRPASEVNEEDWIRIWDGPPTSWWAGGLIFMLIRRGVVLTKILLGKTNQHLKQSIIFPQTKFQWGK